MALKPDNTKAKYRRAMARVEIGKDQGALEDVDQVLAALPDPKSKTEAAELKLRIEAKLKKDAPKETATAPAKPASPKEAAKSAEGFKRMQIVEADDSESDEDIHPEIEVKASKEGIEAAKA